MSEQYAIVPFVRQAEPISRVKECDARLLAEQSGNHLLRFLYPLVKQLHGRLDIRPVRTLIQTVEALVAFRDSTHGLLLTELGSYLDGLGGGGGTKRLGTLIRHRKWKAGEIDGFLWQRADAQIKQWEQRGEDGLVIWDGTVLEKPESLSPEGLCAVRSSKAVRLTHVKKGYYHPPGVPIFVPGIHGIGLLVAGRQTSLGPPRLICMRWWTSRGGQASHEKDENCKLLRQATQWWGRSVVHIFDRGYASAPWLGALRGFDARFILRWKLKSHLRSSVGAKQSAWKIPRGKTGLAPRTIWDAVHHCNVQGSVLFFPVTHPDFPDWPLWLVVGRRKGANPWYLLTNEPVTSADDAWKVVLAYARRWRVEVLFRNLKSELAIQSLRVYRWEDRLKLLALVTLAYAFLMELMSEESKRARDWLIEYACHRTGTHLREVELPFSRLRLALSRLWLAYPCWFVRRSRLNL
ncbi:MAG TPA: transposase [Ktedonobacteraceae bacterium]|nr:transposase [Ktedonobacteraceae bacterium]